MYLKKLGISTVALLCLSTSLPTDTLAQPAQQGRRLGQTTLAYSENDRDVVRLSECPRPPLRSIKVRAVRGSADIQTLIVRYGNNEVDRLSVRENINQGRESRWIDLRGNRRCVRSIAVLADTDNRSRNRAVVEFYGK